MATGRDMQLTKQTGEYLVAAELCRRELIATTFTGNVPDYDILATDNGGLHTIPIQVKTIKNNLWWQFSAQKFLKISMSDNTQRVNGKTELSNPNLIYVFVRLKGQNQDEFYICRQSDVQDIIYKKYTQWLSQKGGKRPQNPSSTHCTLSPEDLKDYRDKWETIKK